MDNRRQPRLRTFLSGRCVFNDRRSVVDCRIRNMTREGARLQFGAFAAVPNEFTLEVPSKGQALTARVIWRLDLELGVSFALAA